MATTAALTFSPIELAASLGIAKITLLRLSARGKIPRPSKIGRSLRWPVKEIEEWLAEGSPSRERWDAIRAAQKSRR